MKLKSKLKRILFFSINKSPILVIIVIILSSSLLYQITKNNYVAVFLKTEGKLIFSEQSKGYVITAEIDKRYSNKISRETPIFWYAKSQGERYKGSIDAIENVSNRIRLRINSRQEDINTQIRQVFKNFNGKLKIEVYLEKQSIFKRLINRDLTTY